ncbi:MAG: hypothetical protein WCK16_04590 [Candidatus Moraniibacteriota bacterium]
MNFEAPINTPEKEKSNPNEELEALISYSESIKETAIRAQAMLQEASERGIKVDNEAISDIISKYEKQMVQMRGDVMEIKTAILNCGVKITELEMNTRLEKMGKK